MLDGDTHRVARFARHSLDPCIQENVDAFLCEQAAKSFAYVRVFFGHQPPVAIDHRHLAAEAAHCLGDLHFFLRRLQGPAWRTIGRPVSSVRLSFRYPTPLPAPFLQISLLTNSPAPRP